jgi:2-keto-4-pentenoate hydratase/2-oxohepta-3-ene-1,7-dioic acid hydratase in catechol pathway
MGMNPQTFLKKGDTIELKIDYLGSQKQNVF